uniref:Phospholipase n=1 Tax=Euplotes crassus TaxID=5936 RepID=A0A7S3NN57_EUPCR|mmetsp:Transcript_15326/g.15211  ORF Transcript_15326/g.15211 Transcript_15326/m.15211 type:complete len:1075 (+) Transcript_15326:2-3226(+)
MEDSPAEWVEPTLENATFVGARAFKIGDYVTAGEGLEESKEIIDIGKSWKKMVGFVIQIKHGNNTWKVTKRRNKFATLQKKLRRALDKEDIELEIEVPEYKDSKKETEEDMEASMETFVEYLNQLAQIPYVWSQRSFLEFCEISSTTNMIKGAVIYREGKLAKRSGGRYKQDSCWLTAAAGSIFRSWAVRWIVITDQYLLLCKDSLDKEPNECLMMDSNFHVVYGKKETDSEFGIMIINNHRRLQLKAKDAFEFVTWLRALKTAMKNNGLQSKVRRSFDAFSPMRENNHVEFFINAHDYWIRLYDELMAAESEVFITDWWMTPNLYLQRPVNMYNGEMDHTRLDNVLKTIAEKGVKVWILVWKEVEVGGMLYNSSQYVKDTLESLHPNIIVQKHPNTLVQFWSHHEKICVIDQQRAFAGGIDLCMGRYDTGEHPLKDKGDGDGNYIFPGKDYSNSRIKDFVDVQDTSQPLIDRNTTPRMPWQDLHLFVRGETAQDLAVHFIEYWNNAKIDVEGTDNKEGAFLRPVENLMDQTSKFGGKHLDGTVDDHLELEEEEAYGVIGKDFVEYIVEEADINVKVDKGAEELEEDFLEEYLESTEKDSDGEVEVSDEEELGEIGSTKDDLSLNPTFFSKMVKKSQKKKKDEQSMLERMDEYINSKKESSYSFYSMKKALKGAVGSKVDEIKERQKLMADFIDDLSIEERKRLKEELKEERFQQVNVEHRHTIQDNIASMFLKKKKIGTCRCQVLRSSSNWSTGVLRVEHSIMNAYIDLILTAEKYVYIENQFFMSNAGRGGVLKNTITRAIKERIIRAHKNDEKFKVFIFIPLMPGFEGDITKEDSQVLKFQVKFQQETIIKGKNSLYSTLRRQGINAEDYVRFFSLRNHDVFDDGPKTEMIYIHSKCLIVDDRVVIMGSANINDRSMLGSRDSEVCLLVQDTDTVESTMGGEDFEVGRLVQDFRKKLMGQHLGVEDLEEINDCATEEFWEFIQERSAKNTKIYYDIFKSEPSDTQRNFDDLKADREAIENMPCADRQDLYDEKIEDVVGHIVDYPVHYMEGESLNLGSFDFHNLVPKINFT